jgi:hypothetical protein
MTNEDLGKKLKQNNSSLGTVEANLSTVMLRSASQMSLVAASSALFLSFILHGRFWADMK